MTSGPDKATNTAEHDSEPREPFLSRWSRRKEQARREPQGQVAGEKNADAPVAPVPELPTLEKLTLESDYRGFFHPKVGEDLRRAALKKLFSDPHFNVMDGLDVYIDDYSKSEPIPAAMLAGLKQAQRILDWAKEDRERGARTTSVQAAPVPAVEPPVVEVGGPDPGVQSAAEPFPTTRADSGEPWSS